MLSSAFHIKKIGHGPFGSTPLYSSCSKFIMFTCSNGIQVYSVKTGLLSASLPADSRPTMITLNIHAVNQVYACFQDGLISLYDFRLGLFIKSWSTDLNSLSMIHIDLNQPDLLVTLSLKDSKPDKDIEKAVTKESVIKIYSTRKSAFIKNEVHVEHSIIQMLKIISEGVAIVVLRDQAHYYLVINLNTGKITRKHMVQNLITALAIDPSQSAIAVGDLTGNITMIRNFTAAEPICTKMHWHAHRVNTLQFTSDGVYLLSGGSEATLVIWQLATGYRQFMPRLGADIESVAIAPDQMQYALGMKDNSLRLISATDLKLKKTISGLMSAGSSRDLYPMSVGLILDPKSGSLVLNGAPSRLQFVSPESCETRMDMDLSVRNRVTAGGKAVLENHISHAAFCSSGDWMVTVDERTTETIQESFLKFWRFDQETQSYDLNTRVDSPHSSSITGLAFSSSGKLCATASKDKSWKLWELLDGSKWVCKLVASYKNIPAQCVAFSNDGTILAIGFGGLVTLWDAVNGLLVKTLNNPGGDIVRDLCFLDDSPHLVAKGKFTMHVWSLLSCSGICSYLTVVLWSVKLQAVHIAVGMNGNFACATEQGGIQVFNAISPVPIYTISCNSKAHGLVFTGPESFAYLNREFEILSISKAAPLPDNLPATSSTQSAQSIFQSIYGNVSSIDVKSKKINSTIAKNVQDLSFLQVPSHIIAVPSKLALTFLESLLERVSVESKDTEMLNGDDTIEPVNNLGAPIAAVPDLSAPVSYDFLSDIFK